MSGSEAKPSPQLMEIVEHGRAIHEQLLETSLGAPLTEGSCLYGSYLLSKMLEQFLPGCSAAIRGGDGCGDGGYLDVQGVWHGHYWVEATTLEGCFVVDVTADQFGAAPVVVLPVARRPLLPWKSGSSGPAGKRGGRRTAAGQPGWRALTWASALRSIR